MANSDEQSDAVDWRRKIDRPMENKTGHDGNLNFRWDFRWKSFPSKIPTETRRILSVSVRRGTWISRLLLSSVLKLGGRGAYFVRHLQIVEKEAEVQKEREGREGRERK